VAVEHRLNSHVEPTGTGKQRTDPHERLAATSSREATPLRVSAANTATIALPHAEVSAFWISESFVYGVFPGIGSWACPIPGRGSSGVRYANAFATMIGR
jgi:hypothetical protein